MYYLILLSLIVQNVLTNEYLYPYPQLYDQQSNGYYKDPISVQNRIRYENIKPQEPEVNPIKVQYDAVSDEVNTKYLSSPKQIYENERYQSLDDKIQKLKLTIGNQKTPEKMKILFDETVKTYNKYKDGEHNDYDPNAIIEKLMEIYLDPRTPKKYKKVYEEIISTYYRNRDLLERTYNNVNILQDDSNNQFDSEQYNYNPESKESESEKDLNDYDINIFSRRNPRRFLKWLKDWFSKIDKSSTTTSTPPTSQLPQIRETGKQLFIATTTELPFTEDSKSKETETLKNITEVLKKLNINIEKQNKLATIILQNLNIRIAQQNNMNTNRKGYIRYKRDLNSEKNDAKESTNSTLETNITEDIRKKCNCSEAKDGRRVYGPADDMVKFVNQSSRVKTKLISYIDDTISEMENKIKPVEKLKDGLLTNDLYKVGYIIANIDTLAVNLKQLKADMDANKDSWDDSAALNVFDKVMICNKVINNLMASLQIYAKFDKTDMQQADIKKYLNEMGLPESPTVVL